MVLELGAARVDDGDATELRADPQHAAAVDHQCVDGVVGQAGIDRGVFLDPAGAAGQRVVTAQPAAVERQPQPAIRGLGDGPHFRLVAAVGIVVGPDLVQAAVRQHPVQPVRTAHPQLTEWVDPHAACFRGGADPGGVEMAIDPVQAGGAGMPDIAVAIAQQLLPRRVL